VDSPRVSVVIPTYNREDYVVAAVESVLHQTWPNVEVVVVDDGSKDRTAEVLAPYAGRITFLRQQNTGLAGARNAGWRASTGELVGFLDSDDLWDRRLVEEVVRVFRERPEADAVALAEREIDPEGNVQEGLHTKRTPGIWFTPEGLIGRDTGVGSGRPPVVKRAVLDRSGGFDATFRNYAVDSEMWIRNAFSIRMTILEQPLVLRRIHPGNVSGDLATDAEYWLKILDRVETEHPDFARANDALMRRTRGKQHLRIGREYLARTRESPGLLGPARANLKRAIAEWPRFHRAWLYLLWSWVAPDLYGRFRQAEVRRR
jgi:glycosyltransferase involved in cell wall biosynthesis